MKSRNKFFAALAMLSVALGAAAQTYPTQTPTYVPAAVLAPQTLSAPGTVVYQVNGLGTVQVQVGGTFTGLAGTFQVTPSRSASAVWTNTNVLPRGAVVSSKPFSNVTAPGLYEVNVTGYAQLRFNLTALSTGSATLAFSGGPGFFRIPGNVDIGAIITNTAQAAGTVNSPDQLGQEVTTVECVFSQTANTAGNTTFAIQGKDGASGLYYNLVQSAAVTTTNGTATPLFVGPGVANTANVSAGVPVPATWRVQEIASGTSTTGTIGCSVH